jgi:hypothetical protein
VKMMEEKASYACRNTVVALAWFMALWSLIGSRNVSICVDDSALSMR